MDWLWNLVSVAVGALVTWAVAWMYYGKAADDLTEAAQDLRSQVEAVRSMAILMLRAAENPGEFQLGHDGNGRIVLDENGVPIGARAGRALIVTNPKPNEKGGLSWDPFVVTMKVGEESAEEESPNH